MAKVVGAMQAFREVYSDSQNFVTPEIVSYRITGPAHYCELSWGWPIFSRRNPDSRIWGVTVILRSRNLIN